MKKLLLFFVSLTLISIGHAKLYPDTVGICYKFDGNKLISRGTCIITFRDGDGGYINLDYQGKKYYYDIDITKPSNKEYYRDLYYEKTKIEQYTDTDELLKCHKDKDYDICFLNSN